MTPSRTRGFTLAELLIVIAIVGILAGIALPAYHNQIIKSNRSAAQQFMMDVATREQQLLLDSRTYYAVTATANFPNAPASGGINLTVPSTTSGKYNFAVTVNNASNPPTFLITATAINGQATDGNLTLDQTGAKTPSSKW